MDPELKSEPRRTINGVPVWCRFDNAALLEDLKPHPHKNYVHPDKQIKLLAKIISTVGWRAPITVSARSGFITKGHARLMAAQKCGVSAAPVEYQAYREEAEEIADLSADNKIAELATLDEDLTRKLLIDLRGAGFDLELAGFTLKEVDKLIEIGDHPDKDPDAIPSNDSIEPVVQEGQLWLLGDHRLLCGSATERDDAARLMADCPAHMVFTDPPYNVDYTGGTQRKLKIMNDKMKADAFASFIAAAMRNYFHHTIEGGGIYVCHSDAEWMAFRSGLQAAGWSLKQCLIWEKNQFVLGRQDYHWRHEPILYGYKPGAGHRWFGGRKQDTVINLPDGVLIEHKPDGCAYVTVDVGLQRVVIKASSPEVVFCGDDALQSIWKVNKPMKSEDHPTTKPVDLIVRAIRNSSQYGEIVADWFGGSGSTLIACERLSRKARIMELDPMYCDVIIKRWETFTGEKALLER